MPVLPDSVELMGRFSSGAHDDRLVWNYEGTSRLELAPPAPG